MKFNKNILKLGLVAPLVPVFAVSVLSCSNQNNKNVWASESKETYNNIWNLTNDASLTQEQIKNSIYSMTIQELENKINEGIKDSHKQKQMKIYCLNLLYNAIQNPYDSNGNVVSNLSKELQEYSSLISKKIDSDEKDGDTFNNLNNFVNKFSDIKIELFGFEYNGPKNVAINKELKVGDIISKNLGILDFRIQFKINDDEFNQKIINPNNSSKSIFYRTATTRDERQIIQEYKSNNPELGELITNQFNYQGTKMYYDIETRTFKTIILSSNVRHNEKLYTKPSGFIKVYDTQRTLFYFDYKQISNKKWNTYLIIDLSNYNYFNTSGINLNWKKYLTKEKMVKDDYMIDIEFNLDKTISYSVDNE